MAAVTRVPPEWEGLPCDDEDGWVDLDDEFSEFGKGCLIGGALGLAMWVAFLGSVALLLKVVHG